MPEIFTKKKKKSIRQNKVSLKIGVNPRQKDGLQTKWLERHFYV